MVDDTVSRIFQRMKNATEQGVPLNFYVDTGEFVDMRDVMRDYNDDLQLFLNTYNYSYEEVIFLYVNSTDDTEMDTKIADFLEKIRKDDYIYDIDDLKSKWSAMVEDIEPKLERFKLLDTFFQPYRDAEAVVPYSSKTLKKAKIEYTSDTLDAMSLYHLLELTPELVYVHFDELTKIHKDMVDLSVEHEGKPGHIYIICVVDGTKVDLDIDTANNTLTYADLDISTLNRIFGEDFTITNEQSTRVQGSFSTQIQNFDDFTFYCFVNGFTRQYDRLVLEGTQVSIVRGEDNLSEIKYPVVYRSDFSSPRSISDSSNYYLRNFLRNELTYLMKFQLTNLGVNNYTVDYTMKSQVNTQHAIQFLKTFFNYYEQHALQDEMLQGKLIVQKWYGEDNPYETGTEVQAIPSKMANLKMKSQTGDSMFEREAYSRNMCECKNQPIIIDKEDTMHWNDYNTDKNKNKPILFPPRGGGPTNSKYYVCPTMDKPVMVLKVNKGKNNKKYPYLPCCAETVPKIQITDRNYLEDVGKGSTKTARQSKSSTPLRQISSKLERFFRALGRNFNLYNINCNAANSFVGCLLKARRTNLPMREDIDRAIDRYLEDNRDTTQDGLINEFRARCVGMGIVEPCAAKQELYDHSDEAIATVIRQGDSVLAYRFFEHLFLINIVILYMDNDDIYVKRPRYHQFHVRNPIRELPVLFLYYDRERYSVIGEQDRYLFDYDIRPLLEPYYKTTLSPLITYRNPYQDIIWEKIFKGFEILGQRIDEDGKIYAVNIRVKDTTVSVYVPPGPPLNVRETSEVGSPPSELVTELFRDGQKGSQGLWYHINKLQLVFIPCSDISLQGKVCARYVSDTTARNDEYRIHVNRSINAKILTEVLEWAWKLSGATVDAFFTDYILKTEQQGLFNGYLNFEVQGIFPNRSVGGFFDWLCQKNMSFQNIIENGKIKLYNKLYTNLDLHMRHLERTAGHPINQLSLTSLRNRQAGSDTLEFTNVQEFNKWHNEEQNLHLLDRLESRPLYVYRSPDDDLFLVKHTETIGIAVDFAQRFRGDTDPRGYTLYDTQLNVLDGTGDIAVIKYTDGYSTFIPIA